MAAGLTQTDAQQARQALMNLELTDQELEALRVQGFVAPEYRHRGGRQWGPYFKLRWRQNGRQRVLYLGSDEEVVRKIHAALQQWQQTARVSKQLENEIEELLREMRRSLQSLKTTLTPQVCSSGKQWHGYEARRPRKASSEIEPTAHNVHPPPNGNCGKRLS